MKLRNQAEASHNHENGDDAQYPMRLPRTNLLLNAPELVQANKGRMPDASQKVVKK